MKQSILSILAFLVVAGISGIANGETEGNVYSNKFVGLNFAVPEDWYIATDNETKEIMPDAARIMGLDAPAVKAVVAQMPGKVLLIVSERPFSSDVQSANRSISFVAMNARNIKNEVGSGGDFLALAAQGMRKTQPTAAISDIVTQRLGGEEFHRFNVSIPMQGITAHTCQLARIHNDYLLILTIAADRESNLTGLVQVVNNNMRLSSVFWAVDSSPEGQFFRQQSSINLSGSSGQRSSVGKFLKTFGTLLMIFGAYVFIRNLLARKKS